MKTQMPSIVIFLLLLSAAEGDFPDQHAAMRMNGVQPSNRAYRETCSKLDDSCQTLGCCPPLVCYASTDSTPEEDIYVCKELSVEDSKGFSIKPLLPVPFFSLIVWWFSKPSPNTWFGDY